MSSFTDDRMFTFGKMVKTWTMRSDGQALRQPEVNFCTILSKCIRKGWLSSRVVSMLDSGAERPGFKSQMRRCRVTVFGKLFTPIVPLFTEQQNW